MATVSRRLLLLAAIFFFVVAIGINLASGGSTLVVVASGLGLIFIVLSWFLFEASSKSTTNTGATPIKVNYSTGTTLSNLQSEQMEQTLPDPLESGFDIPLM
ncbi:MAG TPA: hypothetical protein QF401_00620 [Candidatus Poseidoniaceae archaeon]|nr:hypothetical protein [Candidatus Poseidoniaceae archaeon]